MTVRNRSPPMMYANSHTAGVEMSLREAFTKAGNAAKAQPQLLVCILPTTGVFSFVFLANGKTALYGEIKRVTDTVLGISSQCNQVPFPFYSTNILDEARCQSKTSILCQRCSQT